MKKLLGILVLGLLLSSNAFAKIGDSNKASLSSMCKERLGVTNMSENFIKGYCGCMTNYYDKKLSENEYTNLINSGQTIPSDPTGKEAATFCKVFMSEVPEGKTILCDFDAYGLYTDKNAWKSGKRNSMIIFSDNEIIVKKISSSDLTFALPIIDETEYHIVGFQISKTPRENDNYPWTKTIVFDKRSYETTYMSTNSRGETVYTAKCN